MGNSQGRTSAKVGSLATLPFDLLETIIGCLELTDLASFIKVNKWIRESFRACKYASQLSLLAQNVERTHLQTFLKCVRANPEISLSVSDFCAILNRQYCSCGNWAWHVIYTTTPPQKVCNICVADSKFHLIPLEMALKNYNLKEKDIKDKVLVKILNDPKVHIAASVKNSNSWYVQESCIRTIWEELQGSIWEVPGEYWERMYHVPEPPATQRITKQFGCLTINATLEDGESLRPLICGICRPPESLDKNDDEWPFFGLSQIPWSYERLHAHISFSHKPILSTFEQEWAALPSSFQNRWTQRGQATSTTPFKSDSNEAPIWKSWDHTIVEAYERRYNEYLKTLNALSMARAGHFSQSFGFHAYDSSTPACTAPGRSGIVVSSSLARDFMPKFDDLPILDPSKKLWRRIERVLSNVESIRSFRTVSLGRIERDRGTVVRYD